MYGKSLRNSGVFFLFLLALIPSGPAFAQTPLFDSSGPPEFVGLPEHAVASQRVQLNRRALLAPSVSIDLFGETVVAVRTRLERHRAGEVVWAGHLESSPSDTVIVTARGAAFSGMLQRGAEMYRIGSGADGLSRLFELDLESLPFDDAADLPAGDGITGNAGTAVGDGVVQDLLVVYTQGACNEAGGCSQVEADITTAVMDMNLAYAASGIGITMNLAGTAWVDYSGTAASAALSDLRGMGDGRMDEVHALRDGLGADIVALVYSGEGCGIGYLPASASSAFSVTDFSCLVGNRTMAHEIGHNQGAHHDRQTVGGGVNGAYNYGYRRCDDGSVDDLGSPYFRTVLAYSCAGSPRVGRFSNPDFEYALAAQGVDPDIDPARGAFNARTLNESATYVAGFRTSPVTTPPTAPSGLQALAAGPGAIDLDWLDNATDEDSFEVEASPDNSAWSVVATLGANTTTFTHDGLAPQTTRWYRVRARNGAGYSGYSNSVFATTDPAPPEVEDLASGDVFGSGTVTGSFVDTRADDGSAQVITETHDGGSRKSRRQAYTHGWTFDVFGGAGGVILTARAWVSGSEAAHFFYSRDGGASFNPMFSVDATGDVQTFSLPGDISGPVRIEVRDAEQINGEAVDSVFVDYLVITSYTDAGLPPAAPSGMTVTDETAGSVALQFIDNSEDEFGFEIRRSGSDPGGDCNAGEVAGTLPAQAGTGAVSFLDETVSPNNDYWYWAKAFNGAGDNGSCSNADLATTPAAPATTLAVNAYKVKGLQQADLSWTGLGGTVDVYRNGLIVSPSGLSGTTYTDHIGNKGAGNYAYQVCNAGGTTVCTEIRNAVF